VGATSPVSILKKVLLPEPFGPRMPRGSPCFDREVDIAIRDAAAVVLGQARCLKDRPLAQSVGRRLPGIIVTAERGTGRLARPTERLL